jgi:hypothetical protein
MAIAGLLQRAFALRFQDRDSWKPLLLPARRSGLLRLPGARGIGGPAWVIGARGGPLGWERGKRERSDCRRSTCAERVLEGWGFAFDPSFLEWERQGARGGGNSKTLCGLGCDSHFGADPEMGTGGGAARKAQRTVKLRQEARLEIKRSHTIRG